MPSTNKMISKLRSKKHIIIKLLPITLWLTVSIIKLSLGIADPGDDTPLPPLGD